MKKHVERLLAAVNFAWDELFDFQIQLIVKNSAPLTTDNNFTYSAFPVLGFAVGFAAALVSLMVTGIFNLHAGALVFAVLAWVILCFKDSGRGDCWLANFFLGKVSMNENRDLLRNILNLFPMMIKFLILLFTGLAGNMLYFPVLLATAFALQAALAVCEECEVRFIPEVPAGRNIFYTFLIAAGVISFIISIVQTLAVVAVVAVLFLVFRQKLAASGFDADGINFAGGVTEWSLLAAGLLIL